MFEYCLRRLIDKFSILIHLFYYYFSQDHELLAGLKTSGMNGERGRVDELSVKFEEHSDQLQEVCKLLRHISGTEPLIVWTENAENLLKALAPMVGVT